MPLELVTLDIIDVVPKHAVPWILQHRSLAGLSRFLWRQKLVPSGPGSRSYTQRIASLFVAHRDSKPRENGNLRRS